MKRGSKLAHRSPLRVPGSILGVRQWRQAMTKSAQDICFDFVTANMPCFCGLRNRNV